MDRRNIIGIVAVFVLVILSTVVFGFNRRFIIGDEPDIVGDEETTCCVYTLDNRDANCFPSSIADCTILDGVISGPGCDEDFGQIEDLAPIPSQEFLPVTDDPFIKQLIEDASKSALGTKTKYVSGKYVCKDFSNDLEQYLEGIKNPDGSKRYTATYSSIRFWDENGKYLPKRNHAVVDVHKPDGKIIFIEPQKVYLKDSRMLYNADFNRDGKIKAHVREKILLANQQGVVTEGNQGIWIYDSLQDKNNIHSTTSTTSTSTTSSSTSTAATTSTTNSPGFLE